VSRNPCWWRATVGRRMAWWRPRAVAEPLPDGRGSPRDRAPIPGPAKSRCAA